MLDYDGVEIHELEPGRSWAVRRVYRGGFARSFVAVKHLERHSILRQRYV